MLAVLIGGLSMVSPFSIDTFFPAFHTMEKALHVDAWHLQQVITAFGGIVFKTVGDAVHAVFTTAPDALDAALAAQHALHIEPWGVTGPLRVRMAIHTGAADMRDGDYFGPPLNRVARMLGTGHGGQILLSHATAELVRDRVPPGATLVDLGAHQLKALSRPEQIFHLVSPDLPADFPPLTTMAAGRAPAAALPTDLLATKLFVPPARANLVVRPRLFERVEAGLRDKLTVIAAPAGFGKTTLVSEWIASNDERQTLNDKDLIQRSGFSLPRSFSRPHSHRADPHGSSCEERHPA